MKKEKWIASLGGVDDAFLAEAAPKEVNKKKRITRIVALAACFSIIVGAGLWLFLPFSNTPPDVSRYRTSEYYPLIEKINAKINQKEDGFDNNFQLYADKLMSGFLAGAAPKDDMAEDLVGAPSNDGAEMSPDFEDVTDNQTEGVTEADRFKRTATHIFHLYATTVSAYTISGEESQKVGAYQLDNAFGNLYQNECELYITEDGTRLLLIAPYYVKDRGAAVRITSIDITDPANMRETSSVTVYGSYLSSRMTGGELLFIYNYSPAWSEIDFSDPKTFVPEIELDGEAVTLPMDSITAPDTLTSTKYTVVMKCDAMSLESLGTHAYLSYSDNLYVSKSAVYLTRSYTDYGKDGEYTTSRSMTEISRLAYENELSPMGSAMLEGYLNDQYSLDEYDGILRAVTTTSYSKYKEKTAGTNVSFFPGAFSTNANLYCIDLSDMKMCASVTAFAPEGETVKSVRFDGTGAYVCTSLELSDPVFFFDLSDLANITYKDTGVIEGFSTSLVNFGNGYLLGIGIGTWNTVKLEIYEEGESGVESVAVYELEGADYARDYKAYYIDRENSLVGLAVRLYNEDSYRYILLGFDGYELRELHTEDFGRTFHYLAYMRGCVIDGCLYMFGNGELRTKQIFTKAE